MLFKRIKTDRHPLPIASIHHSYSSIPGHFNTTIKKLKGIIYHSIRGSCLYPRGCRQKRYQLELRCLSLNDCNILNVILNLSINFDCTFVIIFCSLLILQWVLRKRCAKFERDHYKIFFFYNNERFDPRNFFQIFVHMTKNTSQVEKKIFFEHDEHDF